MPDKKQTKKPTQSFEQMVSDASLARLKPFIQQEVIRVATLKAQEQMGAVQGIYERLTALEKLVINRLGVADEEYVDMVADVQDEFYQVKKLDREAREGDLVRIEVATKNKDQEAFDGSSRMMIQQLGSGRSLGKELEAELVGMKAGQVKEVNFGKDKELVAKFTVNRVSGRE